MFNNKHGVAYKNAVYVLLLEKKAKSDLKRIRKLYYVHILVDIRFYCD